MEHEYYKEFWSIPNFKHYYAGLNIKMLTYNFLPFIENIKPGEVVNICTSEQILITYVIDEKEELTNGKTNIITFDFNFVFTYEEGFTKLTYLNLKGNQELPFEFYVTTHYWLFSEFWNDLEVYLFDKKELFPHLW